ncbi:hypothetical protein QBC34DRAFT_428303 [Podospora aff. communis PSN243]|uniref:WSC domain-containing protein n=1 Tax=Podospora aff. communis PSN243 TaxID=3040156 RepID=A0AAV9GE71_9PEZI|nr:hypothetical protein QBC34DRAFT_428303 [Podospora aff. communis PSN243]
MITRFLLTLALVALVRGYVSQPLYLSNRARLHNLKRGISSNPSCPNDFLCETQPCLGTVLCPAGYRCINFEGNSACAPVGAQVCAMNPTIFSGVGCWAGMCCHGQCYAPDAVCCDRPSVTCTLGTACNVCPPDQVCDNNANNGCRTGQDTPPVSESSSIVIPSATSSLPPASSGTPTCRIDSAESLIVRSGSSPISGSTLSQECLQSLGVGWRYFGVEDGVECFWGDAIANTTFLDPACTMNCPGGQLGSSTCGDSSIGIMVFENDAWTPSAR